VDAADCRLPSAARVGGSFLDPRTITAVLAPRIDLAESA
jgi:hypothetical protein